MALIKCHECGAEISDAASQCPKCGAPNVKPIVCPDCGKQIPGTSTICPNCGAPIQSQPVTPIQPSIIPVAAPQQPIATAAGQQQPPRMRPDNHLVWSILNTICCCLPLGIWAIVTSNDVNRLYDAGRYKEAEEAADKASTINITSAVIAGIIWILYVILIVAGVVNM